MPPTTLNSEEPVFHATCCYSASFERRERRVLLVGFEGSSELSVGDRVLVGGCG